MRGRFANLDNAFDLLLEQPLPLGTLIFEQVFCLLLKVLCKANILRVLLMQLVRPLIVHKLDNIAMSHLACLRLLLAP